MAFYFLDSSAVVKNYVAETGSKWLKSVLNSTPPPEIYLASITEVEVTAAITRRAKNGSINNADAATAINQFRTDFANDFRVIEIEQTVLTQAVMLAQKHVLRGYDAVQLSAVLHVFDKLFSLGIDLSLNPFTFVSADNDLNAAALAEGLTIENPNNHP